MSGHEHAHARHYGVMGAGSIGCFVGGMLAAAGFPVTLVGRPRLVDEVEAHGLTVRALQKEERHVAQAHLRVSSRTEDLLQCDFVLVAVKSAGTLAAGRELAATGMRGHTIVSLQNGIRNPTVLRQQLPGSNILGGMVSFNVIWGDHAHFSQTTSGPIVVEAGPVATVIASDLRQAGLTVLVRHDMVNVQWSKLLLNLNNAINALAGIPVREQLSDRTYRRVLAASMREGLAVFAAAGIRMVRFGKLVPKLAPRILVLPDWLFFRVAATMINIDPEARSSMQDDLSKGRVTEIEELNGEIVRLGQEHAVPTPVNEAIVALVREAQTAGKGSPRISARELASAVGLGR